MPATQPKIFAVVPAAGAGSRMSLDFPKQYALINGYPLISYTLSTLLAHSAFEKISVATSATDDYWKRIVLRDSSQQQRLIVCEGGRDRSLSVLAALEALQPFAAEQDWVFVHDAARCGLTDALVNSLLTTLERRSDIDGAILAVPEVDSLKRVNRSGRIIASVDRELYWRAQTPQCFHYGALLNALYKALRSTQTTDSGWMTDESVVMEAQGVFAEVVLSSNENMKVTCDEDLHHMQMIIKMQLDRGDRCSPASFFKKTTPEKRN